MLRGIFGSGGGAAIGGGGTSSPSTIPRWTGPSTLGDSGLIDNGTAIYTTARNAIGFNTATPTANTFNFGASRFAFFDDSQTKLGDDGIIRGLAATGDTGLSYYTSKAFNIRRGNTFVATFDTSGNVGIGETSPATYGRLAVTGSAVGAGILGMNTDATRVDIQSYNKPLAINRAGNNTLMNEGGGNVGIGTASPGQKLNVYTASGNDGIRIETGTNTGADYAVLRFTQGGGEKAVLYTNLTQTVLKASAGTLDLWGSGSSGIRVDTTGNVGIGTASPAGRLDVVGVAGLSWAIRAQVNSANTSPALNAELGLNLKNTSSTVGNYTSITNRDSADNANTQINFINVNNSGSGAINFVTRDSVGGSGERARIDSAGNFILNTANTGATIQAAGTSQGLKLPATPGNADTQTLDCYLDGGASGGATWAPVDNSGAGLTLTVTSARYVRVGRLVLASFDITFPATASGAQAKISLPVTAQAVWQGASIGFGPNVPGLAAAVNNADLNFWTYGAATTNAALSGARLIVSMSYFAN